MMTPADYALLQPNLVKVVFEKHMVLEDSNTPIEHVFFPNSGIGSILALSPQGERVEAGLFGRDGMSGTAIAMGATQWPLQTVVQVPGEATRIDARALRQAIDRSRTLHDLLLLYGQCLAIQTAYTALTNVTHPVEVRLARWLLMGHDRTDGDELALTHDYLSVMLAVRRPSVTTALHVLEGNRLIRSTRGLITVRDRAALEDFADGSYGVPEAEFNRLMGRIAI